MKCSLGRLGVACIVAASVATIYATGGLKLADNAIHGLLMRTVDIPASGDFVVVEINAESLRRLGQWPWPRGHHARVLDQLLEAGAARVAFDVSFSSPSDTAQDARLAEAAARAGDRLTLPVFQQRHTNPEGKVVTVVDRPLPQLFPNTPLASINVRPDSDGIVRRLSVIDHVDSMALPFMATALLPAERSPWPPGSTVSAYDIDFGIDPLTIPRLSYADVLIGRFDPAVVAGRSVLVGATAVELGDVLAVPRWANLPGPLVIATGFETQRLGRIAPPLDAPWFVFVLCLVCAVAPACHRSDRPLAMLLPAVVQLAGLAGLGTILYINWALRLDVAPLALSLVVAHAGEIGRVMRKQAQRIAVQNREAERRQALLRSVVATSIDAVVITDCHGLIRLANPACHTVFGHVSEDLVGCEAAMLISPHDRLAGQLHDMVRSGSVPLLRFPVDVEGLHADGSALSLELALASVAGPDLAGTGAADEAAGAPNDQYYIYVFRDVTAQRQLEASRRQALEARLEAERAKTDFLATASHELRTPLNHIQGFSALLTAGVGGPLSEKQGEYVADIETAATHLFGLVTDILSYAEQADGSAPAEPADVSVADLVAGAQQELATLVADRAVTIAVTGDGVEACVTVDRDSVALGLMHVLRNAVQFSPSPGEVTVAAHLLPAHGTVEIVVTDHGPGMDADQIEHVLGAFGQVESAHARSHGGLGIGLSLARASAERHGGALRIASTKGEGTIVSISLPVSETVVSVPDAA